MKRLMIAVGILVCLAITNIVMGQAGEGVITYEVKINMHRRIPPERAEMKAMIPEFRSFKQQLFFRSGESLYKMLVEDDEESTDMHGGGGGGGMRMQFRMPRTEVYMAPNAAMVLSKQEFMGKEYLIEDSVKVSPWKFGTETKTILGYECRQAYYTDESQPNRKQEVTAWYTDKISPFLGPERFNTLPGAVLAVDINSAERVLVAMKVEMRPVKKNELKVPTGGQKVTQAEYRKIVTEQMKQMGGRDGIVIRN